MNEFLFLLFGILLGFLCNSFFNTALKDNWFSQMGNRFRIWWRKRAITIEMSTFSLGYRKTNIFVVQGNGEYSYTPDSLQARYFDELPRSPDDIADRIIEKERALEAAREQGNHNVWPGIGVGLKSYETYLTADENHLGATISFFKTTYPAFQATVLTIGAEDREDENSIFQNHLAERDPSELVPYLARHVGVVVVVVTSDDVVIATRRSTNVHARPNEFDVSAVEGIEPIKDADTSGSVAKINIFNTVRRGCDEELGCRPTNEEIQILGLAVDQSYYQFNFYAVVRLGSKTFADISRERNGAARDEWEGTLTPIPNTIDDLLSFIKENPMWDTAILGFYWQLVNSFGKIAVEARASQIFNNSAEF